MPRVAILIAASPTPAFFSQLAVFSIAIRKIAWARWQPSLHVYLGGDQDLDAYATWLPHLRDFEMSWVSPTRFAREGDWAQSDDVFRFAPRDVDVLLAMDADTLPVASLESTLDQVLETGSIAGVIAHYPTMRFPDTSVRESWSRIAQGLIDVPLEFCFRHTLLEPDTRNELSLAPFYLNFGVVFFPSASFAEVAHRYLTIRPTLMNRMPHPDFSGQAALTLAIAASGSRTLALPMRYNFPNDPIAEEMYPEELRRVVVFHYLRTDSIDRHQVFTNPEQYAQFIARPLTGVNLLFRESVRYIVGEDYPFI